MISHAEIGKRYIGLTETFNIFRFLKGFTHR